MDLQCPCRSASSGKFLYKNCCQPFINQENKSNTAEQLMRSRYTAYVRKNADYLLLTQGKTLSSSADRDTLIKSFQETEWLGLIIHKHQQLDKVSAIVEFSAFYASSAAEPSSSFSQIHERSFFERLDGRWYYTEGEFLPDVKPSNNQLCFCGSGRKFKRCHGRKNK